MQNSSSLLGRRFAPAALALATFGLFASFRAQRALAGAPQLPIIPVSQGADGYSYFPTGNANPYSATEAHPMDGRMLCVSGGNRTQNYATLSGSTLAIKLGEPAGTGTLDVGIFDGDQGGLWDQGNQTSTWYKLYADPNRDGSGSGGLIGTWNSSQMTDNAWFNLTLPGNQPIPTVDPNGAWNAQNAGGNYFFVLKISLDNCSYPVVNCFKVRAKSPMSLAPTNYGIVVPFTNPVAAIATAQKQAIYPKWPATTTTTYDGTWNFYVDVPTSTTSFGVLDGDMDYGDTAGVSEDTNDQDTAYFLQHTTNPQFAATPDSMTGTQIVPAFSKDTPNIATQGVAVGQCAGVTGNPADDNSNVNMVRGTGVPGSPNICYDVVDPRGVAYHNGNLSGNLEWERFTVTSDPNASPATADYGPGFSTPTSFGNDGNPAHVVTGPNGFNGITAGVQLPGGVWQIALKGMDIGNTNALYPDYDTLGVDLNGAPIAPVRSFVIGSTVWLDSNKNGVPDAGEPGLAGVKVDLVDANNHVVQSDLTDANGHYLFWVDGGSYTVLADAANFTSGQPLYNMASTSGSNAVAALVAGANYLNANLGFVGSPVGNISGTIFGDLNANSQLDLATDAPLSGVTVTLTGVNTATTVSATNGSYSFANLVAGNYQLTVAATVAGATLETSKTLNVTLAPGQSVTSQNFGYVLGSLSGNIYTDLNANSLYEAGSDTALAGVTVTLTGTDVNGTVVNQTTTAAADGSYSFSNLVAANASGYTLTVTTTASGELLETTNPLVVALAAGQNVTSQNFGYVLGNISGLVYTDNNQNSSYDAGTDTVFAGVTVTLKGNDANGKSVSKSTTSAADGSFNFNGLTASDANGYTISAPTNANSKNLETNGALNRVLNAGQSAKGHNFGYIAPITSPVNAAASYTTYTQGGWGGNGVPAKLLSANFSVVYPGGSVTIGSTQMGATAGTFGAKFTSAAAIIAFLPQGGTGAQFSVSATNPTASSAGVLSGQLLAAQLNVDFSAAGVLPNVVNGVAKPLGSLTYTNPSNAYDPCNGMTVSAILKAANQFIAGTSSALPAGAVTSDLTNALTQINQNFDNGTSNNNYLH